MEVWSNMELKQYLRTVIHNKVRPLFIEDKCETCGSDEDLHLHHVKFFKDIVEDVLDSLNLEYRDTNDYSQDELNLIVDVVLGKHLQIKYLTLCKDCHKHTHEDDHVDFGNCSRHEEHYEQLDRAKEIKLNIYIEKVLLPYLENISNKKLFDSEQRELSNLIINSEASTTSKIDYRTKKLKPKKIREIICSELNLPFIISDTKSETKGNMRGKRYILIQKF